LKAAAVYRQNHKGSVCHIAYQLAAKIKKPVIIPVRKAGGYDGDN
jgi:hypothetical protein